jgi:hypothetical protein
MNYEQIRQPYNPQRSGNQAGESQDAGNNSNTSDE